MSIVVRASRELFSSEANQQDPNELMKVVQAIGTILQRQEQRLGFLERENDLIRQQLDAVRVSEESIKKDAENKGLQIEDLHSLLGTLEVARDALTTQLTATSTQVSELHQQTAILREQSDLARKDRDAAQKKETELREQVEALARQARETKEHRLDGLMENYNGLVGKLERQRNTRNNVARGIAGGVTGALAATCGPGAPVAAAFYPVWKTSVWALTEAMRLDDRLMAQIQQLEEEMKPLAAELGRDAPQNGSREPDTVVSRIIL